MREALTVIVILAVILGILWAISYWTFKVYRPKKDRPRILNALEWTEHLGDSDVQTDLRSAAQRFRYLKLGASDIKLHKLEDYRERIEVQLAILRPHERELNRELSRRAGTVWPDLSGLNNI